MRGVDVIGESTQVNVTGSAHQNFSDMGLMWRPMAHLGTLGSIGAFRTYSGFEEVR